MQRRDFVQIVEMTGGYAMTAHSASTDTFDVKEKSVAELKSAMQSGRTTSHQLVQLYLARIASVDKSGPRLSSIIELSPVDIDLQSWGGSSP